MTSRQPILRAPALSAIVAAFLLISLFYTTIGLTSVTQWPSTASSTDNYFPVADNGAQDDQSSAATELPAAAPPATSPSGFLVDDTVEESLTLDNLQDQGQSGATIHPPGVIFSAELRDITTADQSYSLRLEDDGNVILYQSVGKGSHFSERQPVWSLGTGSGVEKAEHVVRLSEDGVVTVIAQLKYEEDIDGERVERIREEILWHSNLLPECAAPLEMTPALPPALELTSHGEVLIQGRCTLFRPRPKSAGKLALLVSGLYRTNSFTCASHIEYLAKNPAAESVDIFAYMLYEPYDVRDDFPVEKMETEIRACYGPYLRTLTLKPVEEVAESFPGPPTDHCGIKLDRLHSQLKTLYLGGMEWWRWTVVNGVKHDTVMRIRTDHEFFGDAPPVLKPLSQLKGNELVMAPIAGGVPVPQVRHWYCSNPFGRLDIAISDQLAYGRPSAMHYFLSMFQDFNDIVASSVALEDQRAAKRESWLCLETPPGPAKDQCEAPESCTIECALSWYLQSWDVEVEVDWDWGFVIRRD